MDTTTFPPKVTKVHLVIEDWLGDDLLQCFPCQFVTEKLMQLLTNAGLSGISFESIKVTEGDQFQELSPGRALPNLWRLLVGTPAGEGEIGVTHDMQLVVSDEMFSWLASNCQLNNCSTSQWIKPPEQLEL